MADKLSDREIADELKRFNETVKLPIDRKKRPLLIKKINHLRAAEAAANKLKKKTKSPRKQNSQFSVEFSSEDESEEESKQGTSRLFGRKPIHAGNAPYYSNTNTIEISPNDKRTNLRSRKNVKDQSAPASSSNLYPDLSGLKATVTRNDGWNFNRGNVNNSEISYDYDGEFTDSDPDESTYEVRNMAVNTTFTLGGSPEKDEEDDDDEEEVSDYIRQTSQKLRSRDASKRQSLSNASNRISSNHVPLPTSTTEETRQQLFKTYEDTRKFKPSEASYVSTGILIIVAVFFLSLASMYVYMRRDLLYSMINSISQDSKDIRHAFILCDEGHKTGQECYSRTEYSESFDLVRHWQELLAQRATDAEATTNMNRKIGIAELQNASKGNDKVVKGALDLILNNPNWNIRAFDASDSRLLAESSVTQVKSLETDPELPFLTRVYRALYKILVGVILLISCVVIMLLGVMGWRFHVKSMDEERMKVFDMVENIIDIIKDNYEANQQNSQHPPYMAVQHVRDQLLAPSQRKVLRPIWEKAVRFIEANESRIRLEAQTIQGEDFMVWRWLPANTNGGKVWQGQAFCENNACAGNTLLYSPTPCLKIRNMFDANVETEHNWEINIQDAVLEKCKNINGILHIHVDQKSREGCVYMKCDSCETAFQVFGALHGWWFDRRLVTVKYLRLKLYHDRFPISKRATKHLKPSNNRMSSLSQPLDSSSLEMT